MVLMNAENCKYVKFLCGVFLENFGLKLFVRYTFTKVVKLSYFVINIEWTRFVFISKASIL